MFLPLVSPSSQSKLCTLRDPRQTPPTGGPPRALGQGSATGAAWTLRLHGDLRALRQARWVCQGVGEQAPRRGDAGEVQLQAVHVVVRIQEGAPAHTVALGLLTGKVLQLVDHALCLVVHKDFELRAEAAEAVLALVRLIRDVLADLFDLRLQAFIILADFHPDALHLFCQLPQCSVDVLEEPVLLSAGACQHTAPSVRSAGSKCQLLRWHCRGLNGEQSHPAGHA
eukprot:CAMPEP_0179092300 /NCGR_PEP_ID=MMETSP0796-20121207/42208_1 /TAXON_ID=73915 /ORGANISM="Pyrodinium bahamense, Strain pbaha01" /LENGTH=225 /DNA_ID=CAMNT_0020789905 /DNA_START=52 /DNA_END=726 /DNA_ORIENTATION=-